jgi:hypothetical protein
VALNDDEPDDAADVELENDEFLTYDASSAIVLHPKQPFTDWRREVFPNDSSDDDEPFGPVVVIIPEFDRKSDALEWLRENCAPVFEFELTQWTGDDAVWPPDRSWPVFSEWFDVTVALNVHDSSDLNPPPAEIDCPPVSLEQIVEELENLPQDGTLFLDLNTGGLVMLSDDQLDAVSGDEDDSYADRPAGWQTVVASARDAFSEDRYLELENPFLLDDGPLMEAFAATVQAPPSVVNRLRDALRGRRASQRFLQVVDRAGLRHRWADFTRDAVTETMRVWLQEMGIPTRADGD